jgi:Zn-finger in ubiquitin-hydrolases and other protein
MNPCEHLAHAHDLHPKQHLCEDCVKTGDSWVHLRICLTCGHVGCCDSSKNKHATRHFHATHHAIIRSIEPGETWGWCYVDHLTYELADGIAHAEVVG